MKAGECMDLVEYALTCLTFTDSGDCHHLSVLPRKSLLTPGIVISTGEQILCYYPRENMWSRFRGIVPPNGAGQVIFSRGKLYFISQRYNRLLLSYVSVSDCWTLLPYEEQRRICKAFLRNGEEIYALMCEDRSCRECGSSRP